MAINGIATTGDFVSTNNCGTSLEAGASCTIGVSFRPTDRGTRTGARVIIDNAIGSPHAVGLTGLGLAPFAELTPSPLQFPSQPTFTRSSPRTIALTNRGDVSLAIESIVRDR